MATAGDGERNGSEHDESIRWLDVPRDEDAPFYRAPGMTPEETYREITDRYILTLDGIRQSWQPGLHVDVKAVQRWHRNLFRTTFPADAGRFRDAHEDQQGYGVWLPDDPDPRNWRMAFAKVAPHGAIRSRLGSATEQ